MSVPSIERLARMVAENGHLVVNDEGIWQKRADGSPLQFTDSIGRKFSPPLQRADFDAWRRAKLISQDLSALAEQGLVFAPTRTGLEVGAKASGRVRAAKDRC